MHETPSESVSRLVQLSGILSPEMITFLRNSFQSQSCRTWKSSKWPQEPRTRLCFISKLPLDLGFREFCVLESGKLAFLEAQGPL